jgi:GDP-D-mannose 3',5'-epimerase
MQSSRILVTGGAGMIGANLVKRLIKHGHKVTVVDNLWRGKLEYLQDEKSKAIIDLDKDFYNIDLSIDCSDHEVWQDQDYVFHLADVVAGIGFVFNNQGTIFRKNVQINSNVIDAIKKNPVKGYIYVGTACSFPAHLQTGVDSSPLKEEDQYPASPESAYGWSKLMGEYEARLMEEETSIPVSIPVLHNAYGTPCDFGVERSQVIPALIRKAINYPDEDFIVWGSGSQGRAFVHNEDIIDAMMLCLEKGLGNGIVQIGPNYCTSIREIAEIIVELSGKDISIIYDTSKPEGDKGRCADFTKARKVLGWEPRVGIREGLAELYNWMETAIKTEQANG